MLALNRAILNAKGAIMRPNLAWTDDDHSSTMFARYLCRRR
jgi:hypothetical protein